MVVPQKLRRVGRGGVFWRAILDGHELNHARIPDRGSRIPPVGQVANAGIAKVAKAS